METSNFFERVLFTIMTIIILSFASNVKAESDSTAVWANAFDKNGNYLQYDWAYEAHPILPQGFNEFNFLRDIRDWTRYSVTIATNPRYFAAPGSEKADYLAEKQSINFKSTESITTQFDTYGSLLSKDQYLAYFKNSGSTLFKLDGQANKTEIYGYGLMHCSLSPEFDYVKANAIDSTKYVQLDTISSLEGKPFVTRWNPQTAKPYTTEVSGVQNTLKQELRLKNAAVCGVLAPYQWVNFYNIGMTPKHPIARTFAVGLYAEKAGGGLRGNTAYINTKYLQMPNVQIPTPAISVAQKVFFDSLYTKSATGDQAAGKPLYYEFTITNVGATDYDGELYLKFAGSEMPGDAKFILTSIKVNGEEKIDAYPSKEFAMEKGIFDPNVSADKNRTSAKISLGRMEKTQFDYLYRPYATTEATFQPGNQTISQQKMQTNSFLNDNGAKIEYETGNYLFDQIATNTITASSPDFETLVNSATSIHGKQFLFDPNAKTWNFERASNDTLALGTKIIVRGYILSPKTKNVVISAYATSNKTFYQYTTSVFPNEALKRLTNYRNWSWDEVKNSHLTATNTVDAANTELPFGEVKWSKIEAETTSICKAEIVSTDATVYAGDKYSLSIQLSEEVIFPYSLTYCINGEVQPVKVITPNDLTQNRIYTIEETITKTTKFTLSAIDNCGEATVVAHPAESIPAMSVVALN